METLLADPFAQFERWFTEAQAVVPKYPEAMTLATVGEDGTPSARIVLFKGFRGRAFSFFTNYESLKSQQLGQNPRAALVFYWSPLDRQVRVQGQVEKLSPEESLEYFHTRPRASQLSAWASPQSREIPDRQYFEDRLKEVERRFEGQEIPLPSFWGGFVLKPHRFEFWEELPARRHDRIVYSMQGSGWKQMRLAP